MTARNRLVLLSAVMLAACPVLADKVTQDPNTQPRPAAAVEKPDERLDRNVTCEAGYARLHAVIERLSADTGVKLYCGSSSRDWQVRDLPVTIYVKDVSVRTVLDTLAMATHLAITSTKVNGERTYRLHRPAALQKEFDDYPAVRAKERREASAWGWDALTKMKDVSDEQIARWKHEHPKWQMTMPAWWKDANPPIWRAMGRVLGLVPQEEREKVLNGKRMMLSCSSSPTALGSAVRDLNMLVWQYKREEMEANHTPKGAGLPETPAPELLETMPVELRTLPGGEVQMGCTWVRLAGNSLGASWMQDLSDSASHLAEMAATQLPPKPERSAAGAISESWGGDWESPLVNRMLDLDAPKGKEEPPFSDFLRALHEKGDLNVICEDFLSQRRLPPLPDYQFFGKRRHVRDTLYGLTDVYWDWGADTNRLLVGQSRHWRSAQMSLVRESVHAGFCEKLENGGVQLEDYLFTAWLSEGLFQQWFEETRCVPPGTRLDYIRPYGRTFWHLYDLLSPEHKALAKSDRGFPLSECDPKWLAEAIESRQDEVDRVIAYNAIAQPDVEWGDDTSQRPIPLDPETMASMRMYVIGEGSRVHRAGESEPAPGRSYHLRITWWDHGQQFEAVTDQIGTLFPIVARGKARGRW